MRDDGVTKQDMLRSAVRWLKVDVEPTPLQKFLRPFFILAAREFLRRKKEMSFMGVRGVKRDGDFGGDGYKEGGVGGGG